MSKKSVFEVHVPSSQFSITDPMLHSKSENKVVFIDANGDKVTFEGSNISFKNGVFQSGTFDNIVAETENGKPILTFTNIDLDIQTLPKMPAEGLLEVGLLFGLRHDNLLLGSKGSDELSGYLGNDILKGFGGDDGLQGGVGNDVLSGGGGEDVFLFIEGDGKDRITDFDADNGDGKQDLISADFNDVLSIKNVKGNAVINFGDGDTITLVGVKANEIDASDFAV